MAERVDWAKMETVRVEIPRCPFCGATTYKKVRTEANGDGTCTRKVICRGCETPYKILCDLPESGNDDFPTG